MVIFNGSPQREDIWNNRAFLYGDGVFETLRVAGGRVLFLEDHYFRLMSSMRILRMEIPMSFTMEYFADQALLAAAEAGCALSARVRFTVFRQSGGRYLPQTREVNWHILAEPMEDGPYIVSGNRCEADLYKDFYVPAQLLSTLKTTNRLVNITASVFAEENGLDNCLLVNDAKNVVEAINGNLFLLIQGELVTPPLSEGCLNGIMRRQIIQTVKKDGRLNVVERPVSPFELQKADEMWVTNVISGIVPITQYRKKDYGAESASTVISLINSLAELS